MKTLLLEKVHHKSPLLFLQKEVAVFPVPYYLWENVQVEENPSKEISLLKWREEEIVELHGAKEASRAVKSIWVRPTIPRY